MEDPTREEIIEAADLFYGELKGVKPRDREAQKEFGMDEDNRRKGSTKGRVSPVVDYVRSLGKDYRTTQEVADELGLSANTIRNFSKNPDIKAPSYVAPFGKTYVRLYTPEDIEELREHVSDRHPMTKEEYEQHKDKKE